MNFQNFPKSLFCRRKSFLWPSPCAKAERGKLISQEFATCASQGCQNSFLGGGAHLGQRLLRPGWRNLRQTRPTESCCSAGTVKVGVKWGTLPGPWLRCPEGRRVQTVPAPPCTRGPVGSRRSNPSSCLDSSLRWTLRQGAARAAWVPEGLAGKRLRQAEAVAFWCTSVWLVSAAPSQNDSKRQEMLH